MKKAVLVLAIVLTLFFAREVAFAAPCDICSGGCVGLSALISLADTHIKGILGCLEILADTKEVKSGDWNNMIGLLAKLQKSQIPMTVGYVLPNGSYCTVDKGKTDQNLKGRAYFSRVMSGYKVFGELVVSKSTGRKSVIAAIPVKKDGKIIGALIAAVFLDKFSEILAKEIGLPKNMLFYALDSKGRAVLHSDAKWVFEEPGKQRSKTLSKAVKEILSKNEGVVTYEFEGVQKKVVFKKSSFTGWKFALGVRSLH